MPENESFDVLIVQTSLQVAKIDLFDLFFLICFIWWQQKIWENLISQRRTKSKLVLKVRK